MQYLRILSSQLLRWAEQLSCLLLLAIRLTMAQIFWASGMVKIQSWDSTLALFEYEYQVPILPPEIAAYLATAVELSCPVLLAIGLATRLTTIPLLVMTAVIQFTYQAHMEHTYWALLLGTLLLIGPGRLSLDHLIRRKLLPGQ